MRSSIAAVFLSLLGFGCLNQVGSEFELLEVEEDGSGLRLEGQVLDGGGLSWILHNDTDADVTFDCRYGCPVRLEAEQPDGSWVGRQFYGFYDRDEDASIPAGHLRVLEDTRELEPGTYRLLARVERPSGAVDVARELTVVGWDAGTMRRALALHDGAEADECWGTTRDVWDSALESVEPDLVLDLQGHAEDADEHWRVWDALTMMLRRGMFVSELSDEVRSMSDDDVVRFVRGMARLRQDQQTPLRGVVAARLFDRFEDHESPLDVELLSLLSDFDETWPAHATDTIVERLSTGPEQGARLGELIDVIVYSRRELFEPYAPQILAALDARCDDEAVLEACERAYGAFPEEGFGSLYGRGSGSSWGCGGAYLTTSGSCARWVDEWTDFRQSAETPTTHVLGGYLIPVAPE